MMMTGHEALASHPAQDAVLPLRYLVSLLLICHLVVLIYRQPGNNHQGMAHLDLVLEYNDEGRTHTLYCHGLEHIFQLPGLTTDCTGQTAIFFKTRIFLRKKQLILSKIFVFATN